MEVSSRHATSRLSKSMTRLVYSASSAMAPPLSRSTISQSYQSLKAMQTAFLIASSDCLLVRFSVRS